MINYIYKNVKISIFKIPTPNNINLKNFFEIFEQLNFSKSRNLKFRHQFKKIDHISKLSNDTSLAQFLKSEYLIKLLSEVYNKTYDSNYIFRINNRFNRMLSLFNKKIKLVDVSIEASLMIKNAFILPHVDSPKKLITLMLYLPTEAQKYSKNIHGSFFYEIKNKHSKFFSNPENIEVSEENLNDFYNEANLLCAIPFDQNYLYGFVRTDKSWHEVKPVLVDDKRRSLNINFYDPTYLKD
jgi:hypothetical protein